MRGIQTRISTFLALSNGLDKASVDDVRIDDGAEASGFPTLVGRIAEIAYHNPEFTLLFRGQGEDYVGRTGKTVLYPSLLRPSTSSGLSMTEIAARLAMLNQVDSEFVHTFSGEIDQRLNRSELLRWAIIQHYQIYPTPLLDVTQSLRVACTFAQEQARNAGRDQGFVFVFGLPPTTGAITSSVEHSLQIIRLLSTCPPRARRPHFQEGFLLSELPTLTASTKPYYKRAELDFSRRLIAKFRIDADESFWLGKFGPIPMEALVPDDRDPFAPLASTVTRDLNLSGLRRPEVFSACRPILKKPQPKASPPVPHLVRLRLPPLTSTLGSPSPPRRFTGMGE